MGGSGACHAALAALWLATLCRAVRERGLALEEGALDAQTGLVAEAGEALLVRRGRAERIGRAEAVPYALRKKWGNILQSSAVTALGSGAFGTAYLVETAEDCSAAGPTKVVVKMAQKPEVRQHTRPMPTEYRDIEDPNEVLEAKIQAQLKHPNLLQVYDWVPKDHVDSDNDLPRTVSMLMEYSGCPRMLEDIIRLPRESEYWTDRELRGRFVAELGVQLFTGLAYMHSMKVVHRDIKPDNLLIKGVSNCTSVPDDFVLKIADFGLACTQHRFRRNLKPCRTVAGTAGYIPPESFSGWRKSSYSHDLFAAGAVLYRLYFRRLPIEVLSHDAFRRYQGPKIDAGTPLRLRAVLSTLLARQRLKRGTAVQALRLLRRWQEEDYEPPNRTARLPEPPACIRKCARLKCDSKTACAKKPHKTWEATWHGRCAA